jgi:hypothetical protein
VYQVGYSRETEPKECAPIYKEISFKELAYMDVEMISPKYAA